MTTPVPPSPPVTVHRVTYTGSETTGYTWRCTCGERCGVPWLYKRERRMDAHEHLLRFEQQPPSCRGCCYTENHKLGRV